MTKIALVQQRAGADKTANVERGIATLTAAAAAGAKVVCFPELAFEPFYPQCRAEPGYKQLAEPVPGPTTDRFAALAKQLGVVVVLNLFERDNDRCYDTSPVIDADGTLLGRTRMIHITDYPGFHEQDYYTPGDTGAPVYDTRCGRIGIAICYDRHFPEYMRALGVGGADLVLVPQAGTVGEWPEGLFEAEIRVAAFQNGYFVGLCNRVGTDGTLTFAGESFVATPDGTVLARAAGRGAHSDRRPGLERGGTLPCPPPLLPGPQARTLRYLVPGRSMTFDISPVDDSTPRIPWHYAKHDLDSLR